MERRKPPRAVVIIGLVSVVLLAASALIAFPSALAVRASAPPTVQVPRRPSTVGSFKVTYRPREMLPDGGFYYAVVVVNKDYAAHFASVECSKESRMDDTEYGYPRAGRPLTLTLAPERALHWCAGATYIGAIYAVPHPPPCTASEACYGHSNAPECYPGETSEPLEYCNEGKLAHRRLYGVVARPYKGGGVLPAPRDDNAYMVARFKLTIGKLRLVKVSVPRDPPTGANVTIGFDPKGENLPERGYYYAALVLPRQRAKHLESRRCSRESVMDENTQYGYPRRGELFVKLTLTQADRPFHWCAGASYEGAVYGVLEAECPERGSACSQTQETERLMTHLRRRPGALPQPLDTSVYLIGRFQVRFGSSPRTPRAAERAAGPGRHTRQR